MRQFDRSAVTVGARSLKFSSCFIDVDSRWARATQTGKNPTQHLTVLTINTDLPTD